MEPQAITFGPDGSLYLADVQHQKVRKIDTSAGHIITTVAGTGTAGAPQDGIPAATAQLNGPTGISVSSSGVLYIADSSNGRVRAVDTNGMIRTAAGTVAADFPTGDGGPATSAVLLEPNGVLATPDGNVYIASNHQVRVVGVDGIIRPFAGSLSPTNGDGGPAATAQLSIPYALARGADGSIYIADKGTFTVRRVNPAGTISTVAGISLSAGFSGDGGPATAAHLDLQSYPGVTIGANDILTICDDGNRRIRQVQAPLPGVGISDYLLGSPDGSQIYVFDPSGRHLQTVDAYVTTPRPLYTFAYDPITHYLTSVTDVVGNVTKVLHDPSGNITGITPPFAPSTAITVGSDGYIATITDPSHRQTSFTYYPGGLLQNKTSPRGFVSTHTYDPLGRLTLDADPPSVGGSQTLSRTDHAPVGWSVTRKTALGRTTQYSVSLTSTNDRQRTIIGPDNLPTSVVNGFNGTDTTVEPDGTTTTVVNGPDPRFGLSSPIPSMVTIRTPSGLTSQRTASRAVMLSTATNLLSLQSATTTQSLAGNTWTSTFNPSALTWTTMSPVGRMTTVTLDALGRVSQIAPPGVTPVMVTYDPQGRLKTTTQGNFTQGSAQASRTWTMGYDTNGYLQSVTDPLQAATSYMNDGNGRPTDTFLPTPDGGTRDLKTGYDGDDNLTSVTLPRNPSQENHQLLYTAVDQLATYTPPSLGTGNWSTSDQYDTDHNLQIETRPDSSTIVPDYDSAGRLSHVTYPQGVITRGYDPTSGRLHTVQAANGETLTYGNDGPLLTGLTWSGSVAGSVVFGYDTSLRVNAQQVNGASLSFGYDNDNLITSAGAETIGRDPQTGFLTGTTLGSIVDSYGYDSNGYLASYTAKFGSTLLYNETIVSRDGAERILERTETIGATTTDWVYAYDVAGRLTTVTKNGTVVSQYGYDADDNRTSVTFGNGPTIVPTYDAQDRLMTYGGTTFTYGANGELATKTTGSQVLSTTYDVFGSLLHAGFSTALPDGTTSLDYVVDGENRRVGRSINGAATVPSGYLYQDALRVVAQLDGSGNVASRFVYGSRANVPDYFTTSAGTFRILGDHLGSPRLVVNASTGIPIEEIDYDEFGNVTNDTAPGTIPFGFAGGLYDRDTGLVQFGARDYDPSVGRWTSKDPTRFVGGVNLYDYVGNDPVNFIDPAGTWAYVSQTGNNVQITIPIYFTGQGATAQNINNVVNQIQNTWSGNFDGYNVTTSVQLVGDPNTSPVSSVPTNVIELFSSTTNGGSNTVGWGFLGGQWDISSPSPTTFAHEASHLLGLSDQYRNQNDITFGLQGGRSPAASPTGSDIAQAVRNNPWAVECR